MRGAIIPRCLWPWLAALGLCVAASALHDGGLQETYTRKGDLDKLVVGVYDGLDGPVRNRTSLRAFRP